MRLTVKILETWAAVESFALAGQLCSSTSPVSGTHANSTALIHIKPSLKDVQRIAYGVLREVNLASPFLNRLCRRRSPTLALAISTGLPEDVISMILFEWVGLFGGGVAEPLPFCVASRFPDLAHRIAALSVQDIRDSARFSFFSRFLANAPWVLLILGLTYVTHEFAMGYFRVLIQLQDEF